MRDNPVKQELQRGGHAFGTMVFEFFSPDLPQILRAAGAEFALFDMEHSGAGIETMKTQAALCRGIDLVPMVRVPATQYHLVSAVLDAGMMEVMVPMVESPARACEIVSFTRYPPQGMRGAAFGIAHDDYKPGPAPNKMRAAMVRTMVIALIETARYAAAVDEIAAVDGVDMLWLGHFECFASIAKAGFCGILESFAGRVPAHVVNREVLDHPCLAAWLGENARRAAAH